MIDYIIHLEINHLDLSPIHIRLGYNQSVCWPSEAMTWPYVIPWNAIMKYNVLHSGFNGRFYVVRHDLPELHTICSVWCRCIAYWCHIYRLLDEFNFAFQWKFNWIGQERHNNMCTDQNVPERTMEWKIFWLHRFYYTYQKRSGRLLMYLNHSHRSFQCYDIIYPVPVLPI